jgi:hypothetical protein
MPAGYGYEIGAFVDSLFLLYHMFYTGGPNLSLLLLRLFGRG